MRQYAVSLPDDVAEAAQILATAERRSLSWTLRQLIEQALLLESERLKGRGATGSRIAEPTLNPHSSHTSPTHVGKD